MAVIREKEAGQKLHFIGETGCSSLTGLHLRKQSVRLINPRGHRCITLGMSLSDHTLSNDQSISRSLRTGFTYAYDSIVTSYSIE